MDTHQKYFNHYTQNINAKGGEITKYFLEEEYVKGTIIRCELEQGMEMLFFDYKVKNSLELEGFEKGNIIEIFYCLSGNIVMEQDGYTVALKDNMIGIYDFNTCPQKVKLENGRVKGISLLLDIDLADRVIRQHLSRNILTMEQIRNKIMTYKRLFLAFGNENLRGIFLGIAENPFDYEKEYLLLKALELVLISCKSLMQKKQDAYEPQKGTRQYKLYEKAVSYMEYHIADPITVLEIADSVGVKERQINRYFLEYSNQTVYAYLKAMRLQKAKQLLVQTRLPVTEIAGESGWQNPSKFTAAFKQKYGVTPKDFREKNKFF